MPDDDGQKIHAYSVASLLIEQCAGTVMVGSATGFLVQGRSCPLLITNRHCVTGRDQTTGQQLPAAIPDRFAVWHLAGPTGETNRINWIRKFEPLYHDEACAEPRWIEHPRGPSIDVVALPLTQHGLDIRQTYLEIPKTDFADIHPTDSVRIVGFPFGRQPGLGGFAIWSTGFVASEPATMWNGLPTFLVDCRARQGQSGSPVYVYEYQRRSRSNNPNGVGFVRGLTQCFLGVYSGRINVDSDLGVVWRAHVVRELIDAAP